MKGAVIVTRNRELTVRQTAIQLGCTLKNVYDLLYAGRLQGAEKVGRIWRIPAEAVEARIKNRNQ
jgi:excisionase family DNA binding protein